MYIVVNNDGTYSFQEVPYLTLEHASAVVYYVDIPIERAVKFDVATNTLTTTEGTLTVTNTVPVYNLAQNGQTILDASIGVSVVLQFDFTGVEILIRNLPSNLVVASFISALQNTLTFSQAGRYQLITATGACVPLTIRVQSPIVQIG